MRVAFRLDDDGYVEIGLTNSSAGFCPETLCASCFGSLRDVNRNLTDQELRYLPLCRYTLQYTIIL